MKPGNLPEGAATSLGSLADVLSSTKAAAFQGRGRHRRHFLACAASGLAAPLLLRGRPGRADRALRIGHVSPQTGPLAAFGEADPFVLAQIERELGDGIDTAKGHFAVEILTRDSQSNPNRAAEVAAELILDQEVDLLVAASTPDTVNPVADQAEVNEVPCITTDCPWQSYFFGRGGDRDQGFAWTYHFFFGLDDAVRAFLALWRDAPTNRRIGVVFPNDTDGNHAASREHGVIPVFERGGYEVVDPGRFTPFTDDFSAIIAELKRADVDIINGVMVPSDFATFWAQAGQQALRPKIATIGKALLFPSAVDAIGPRADGLSAEIWWSPHHPFRSGLTGESAGELAAAYQGATGRPWTQPIGYKHALFEVAIDVLRRADDPTDRGAIMAAIRATAYDSVVGPIRSTSDPVPNVGLTPLVSGQWRLTDRGFDLVVCQNETAPQIPVQDRLRLLS